MDYYTENDLKVLEWPAYSPDLNPIENIWGAIKNSLAGKSFTNVEALSKEISEHRKHLTADNWLLLTNSMRDRINTWIFKKKTSHRISTFIISNLIILLENKAFFLRQGTFFCVEFLFFCVRVHILNRALFFAYQCIRSRDILKNGLSHPFCGVPYVIIISSQ